jgi:hypothetical protein
MTQTVCGGFHNLIRFNCAPLFASYRRHRVLTVTCLDAFRCAAYLITYGVEVFFYFDHFTDGRTPWTSDQLVAKPLPKHRTTQTQNKHYNRPIKNDHQIYMYIANV